MTYFDDAASTVLFVTILVTCLLVGGYFGWLIRGVALELGECDMCDRRRVPGSDFCTDHAKTAAKVSKTLRERQRS